MKSLTIQDAVNYLAEKLRGMEASGSTGFEGLMRDVLDEVTGQRFHIAKSGHQEGSDVRTEPANAFRIGLEGKRYGAKTHLGLDQLKAKIVDAAHANEPVDLWILAATREVSITDREALTAVGLQLGIGVIVIDWPQDNAKLPDLAVLCAIAQKAMALHFKNDKELKSALSCIENSSEFADRREFLVRLLTEADVGYEATRKQVDRWLDRSQENLQNALSRLKGYHNLREDPQSNIPRAEIFSELDEWWSTNGSLMALLGEEGSGKTWAVLGWRNIKNQSGDWMPLTIFLNAKDVSSTEPHKVLAGALSRQTETFNEEFWIKRLRLWERSPAKATQILIILDGLNENAFFDNWSDFIQPLFEDSRLGMYSVIITCWPTLWGRLENLAPLSPRPSELIVSSFSDSDLDALLKRHGLNRSSFSKPVLDLMRVPRLSQLAIEQRAALLSQGEVTPERLIYEDWKNRLVRKGAVKGLSDPEMRALVAELGRRISADIKGDLTRKEIIDALAKDSGFGAETLEEAVYALESGRWLQPTENPHKFTIDASKTPFVLGATLVADLKGCFDSTMVEARIAQFLEPLKAHSIGTAILRAAMVIALLDSHVSRHVRQPLLFSWLKEPNFSSVDFYAYWASAGLDIELYLDLAEEIWTNARKYVAQIDEILIKGLANAHSFEAPAKAIEGRVIEWLGWIWPDPRRGQLIGSVDLLEEGSIERASETRRRFNEWSTAKLASSWPAVKIMEGRDISWMGYRVVAMLSHTPRAPFVEGIVAWGLGRALMQSPRHYDELAWMLRLNDEDEAEARENIKQRISDLRSTRNEVCLKAAEWIETALCKMDRISSKELADVEQQRKAEDDVLADESVYADQIEFPDPENISLPEISEALFEYLAHTDARYVGESDVLISRINGAIVRVAEERSDTLLELLTHIRKLWLIFTPKTKDVVIKSLRLVQKTNSGGDSKAESSRRECGFLANMLSIQNLSAEQQAAYVRDMETPHLFGDHDDLLLRPLSNEAFEALDGKLPQNDSVANLRSWLSYLLQYAQRNVLTQWRELDFLVIHRDDQVRYWAIKLTLFHQNVSAAKAYASDHPGTLSIETDRETKFHHTYMLLLAHGYSPDNAHLASLDDEAVAIVCDENPEDSRALLIFNNYLEKEFKRSAKARSRQFPNYWLSYERAVKALVLNRPDALFSWLRPFLNEDAEFNPFCRMEQFPIVSTMQVLAATHPEVAEKILERLKQSHRGQPINTTGLLLAAFSWPAGEHGDRLRREAVESAHTDETLLQIACAAERNNHQKWIVEYAEQAAISESPSHVARAYTLIGFCDEGECIDKVWHKLNQHPPADRWLRDVWRSSRSAYERNQMAKRKVKDFWKADSEVDAFVTLREAIDVIDSRAVLWPEIPVGEAEDYDRRRLQHMNFAISDINRRIKKRLQGYKRTLFHTRIPAQNMAPWSN